MNLAGSCDIVIDLGKDHSLQGIYLSDREQMSHLSKNGRNKHKGALVLTGNLASKALRQTVRVWLKTGLRSSPMVTHNLPNCSRADARGKKRKPSSWAHRVIKHHLFDV